MANDNAQNAKSHFKEAGEEVKKEAKDRLEDLKEGYHEAKGQAKGKLGISNSNLKESCDKIKGYIKSNPFTAIGVAAATGMAIGTLLKRK